MATVLETPVTALVPATDTPNAVVLFDTAKFDAFYAKLKADVDATPVDLATDKGRKAIASVAAKVRSEKAGIDRDRKKLTQEWRDNTALVNGAWNTIKDQLDTLAVEARKPLTEWEEAEAVKLDRCNEVISDIHGAAIVTLDDTSETVRERGMRIWAIEIGEDFGTLANEAEQAKSATIATLQAAMARLKVEEADKAELQRLRDEAAARAEADRVADEAVEAKRLADEQIEIVRIAAEQAKAEEERQAEIAEERRIANEQAEAKRIEDAKAEAAAEVQREADRQAELAERKRAYARQIIAHIQEVGLGMIGGKPYPYGVLLRELEEKIVIDDSLGDMQEEVRAIRDATLVNVQAAMERQQERAAQQELAEEERLAQEAQAKRDADQKHKTAVMKAAKEAIMTTGADEETAKKIVLLIRANEVPHVRLQF